MEKKKPSNRGRNSKWEADFPERVEEMAREGMIEADMAKSLGINVDTLNTYKKRHPEFLVALKRGKKVVDDKVISALFQRASGYSHDDVHISNYQGEITETPITKHYPPDPTSMIFWLKNRCPEEWRDHSHQSFNARIDLVERKEYKFVVENSKELLPDDRREIFLRLSKGTKQIEAKALSNGKASENGRNEEE